MLVNFNGGDAKKISVTRKRQSKNSFRKSTLDSPNSRVDFFFNLFSS